jgi:long-chain acyl-CoA synthetase
MEVKRLFDFPYYQLEKYPNDDALVSKVNGTWKKVSTAEFIEKANLVSKGLLKLGIKPGDKVAIITSVNRTEWNIMDIGVLQIGAVDVPMYPTISIEDYAYIFNHSEAKICVVSDEELYKKAIEAKKECPNLQEIYTFEEVSGAKNWNEILELGKTGDQAEVDGLKAKVDAMDLATLIYTSGTTGKPKGVMVSHNNLVQNIHASIERLPVDNNGKALSFLPVCHVYERMIHYLYMYAGVSIYFAESMETIGDNLKEVKPQVFTAVPRLLEKVYDKIVAKGDELTGLKRKLFFWALDLGHQYELNGANGGWYEFKLKIARKLIFSKWQEALGGNTLAVASGAAALQPRLARVFNAAGIPVMEGYGLTESAVVISVNCQDNDGLRFGSVGKPLKNVEVKIAEDGEILSKGPSIMMGYYKDEEKTKEVIDDQGWLHTGDIGEFDKDGFLRITDRKKEIFKTSGGKYVAPQVLENKFKESQFIEQIMVIGEGEKHPAALIVPAYDFVRDWASKNGVTVSTNEELVANEKVIAKFQEEVDKTNAGFGGWEQVKKFELLPKEFSIEGGELTPTLKLKRRNVMDRYKHLAEKIYRG